MCAETDQLSSVVNAHKILLSLSVDKNSCKYFNMFNRSASHEATFTTILMILFENRIRTT